MLSEAQILRLDRMETDVKKLISKVKSNVKKSYPTSSKSVPPDALGKTQQLEAAKAVKVYSRLEALIDLGECFDVTYLLANNTSSAAQATIHYNEAEATNDEIQKLAGLVLEDGAPDYKPITDNFKAAKKTLTNTLAIAKQRANELNILAQALTALGRIVAVA